MGIVRKTKSVERLLHIFNESQNALSVVQLIESTGNYMNKTTVYRILERFEQEGIVHSFLGKNGLKWYAKCRDCPSKNHLDAHPHFQCLDCGNVECLSLDITIPTISNCQIDSVEIMLTGKCANCMA